MIKTKGNSYYQNGTQGVEVWDALDVVKPPLEDGATFLTTNFLRVLGQTRGLCDSNDKCTNDTACQGKSGNVDSGGIRTGACSPTGFCTVNAWCPVEPSVPGNVTFNYLQGIENFTLFVRVSVNFATTGIATSTSDDGAIKTVSELLALGGISNYSQVHQVGALMALSYDFECNLDTSISKCIPKTSVYRLDDPKSKFSTGFNYRYANSYSIVTGTHPVEYRDLYKVYGLRFVVLVTGLGRKFDVKELATNLGSGLAMLSIAAVVADIMLIYILPKKHKYRAVKVDTMDKFVDETDGEDNVVNSDDPTRRETSPLLKKTV